jgi:hypothetical protein
MEVHINSAAIAIPVRQPPCARFWMSGYAGRTFPGPRTVVTSGSGLRSWAGEGWFSDETNDCNIASKQGKEWNVSGEMNSAAQASARTDRDSADDGGLRVSNRN